MAQGSPEDAPSVVHLSTTERSGGAARAASRIHVALREAGVDSSMLVRSKDSDDSSVTGYSLPGKVLDACQYRIEDALVDLSRASFEPEGYPASPFRPPFSLGWLPGVATRRSRVADADVVHLHWINDGFLSIAEIGSLRQPVVWTCHDMWPFTGGCHYAWGCEGYTRECRTCPQLDRDPMDLAWRTWQKKCRALESVDLTVVAPSEWLADCARRSSLLEDVPVRVIPYCLDTTKFRERDRVAAREAFNLPADAFVVGIGADYATPRKGAGPFSNALDSLKGSGLVEDAVVTVFGVTSREFSDTPFEVRQLGHLDDGELSAYYAAIDCCVVPSLIDNLPLIAMEALASGTPCVGFDIGGLPDMIDHEETGYLAPPFNVEALARGIQWVADHHGPHVRDRVRRRASERFGEATVADQYTTLYRELRS